MSQLQAKVTVGPGVNGKNGKIVDLPSVSKPSAAPALGSNLSAARTPQILSPASLRSSDQPAIGVKALPPSLSTIKDPVVRDTYRLLTDTTPYREKVVDGEAAPIGGVKDGQGRPHKHQRAQNETDAFKPSLNVVNEDEHISSANGLPAPPDVENSRSVHYDTSGANRSQSRRKSSAANKKLSISNSVDTTGYFRHLKEPSIAVSHSVKPVFVELDSLEFHQRHQQWHWQEVARWLYQEEDYYRADNSFTVARSSVLQFEAIVHLQKHLERALISLDVFRPTNWVDLVNNIVDEFITQGMCNPDDGQGLRDTLLLYHKHVGEKYTKDEMKALGSMVSTSNVLDLLGQESLPDKWRRGSISASQFSRQASHVDDVHMNSHSFSRHQSIVDSNAVGTASIWSPVIPQHHFQSRLRERLPPSTEAAIVQVGIVRRLERPLCAFVRLAEDFMAAGLIEVDSLPLRFIFILLVPLDYSVDPVEIGRVFSSLLVTKDFRSRAYTAQFAEDIVAGVASVLTSTVVIPLSRHVTKESLNGMMEQIMKFKRQLEEKEHAERERRKMSYDTDFQRQISQQSRRTSVDVPSILSGEHAVKTSDGATNGDVIKLPAFHDEMPVLSEEDLLDGKKKRSCCSIFIGHYPFYYLLMDIWRGFVRRYPSDWIDAFRPISHLPIVLSGSIFVYFTLLAPAITFGALLSSQVNPNMTVALTVFSSGIVVLIMVLFGGQPFFVPGPTGPVYIVETVATSFSASLGIKVECMRFYIGIYTAAIGLLLHCFNASRIIRLLRNSTAELFNAFIAFFFLLKALFSMFKPLPLSAPTLYGPLNCTNCSLKQYCSDLTTNYMLSDGSYVCLQSYLNMGQQTCGIILSVIMLFICLFLVEIKRGRYLRRRARFILGSLNVPIGILITTMFSYTLFRAYKVPTLAIPASIDPATLVAIPNWNLTFSREVAGNGQFHGYSIVLAICLTLIVFTETSMTSVIVAGPQRKLVKTPCYTLDLFIMLVVLPILSGVLGWPFMGGAVVRAFVHAIAMTKWDDKTPPGVPHKIIGAAEQRLSGVISSSLTALSVVLGVILRLIPMHAMYGMFLYMGIMGLRELHMKRRLIALLKRRKHWSDQEHLRGIPRYQMLVFVLIVWFFCLVIVGLNVISEFMSTATWTAVLFPVVVIVYMIVRELILPRIGWLSPYLETMDRLPSVVLVPPKAQKKTIVEPIGSVPALTSFAGSKRPSIDPRNGTTPNGDPTLVTNRLQQNHEISAIERAYSVEASESDSYNEEPLQRRDVEYFYRTVTA